MGKEFDRQPKKTSSRPGKGSGKLNSGEFVDKIKSDIEAEQTEFDYRSASLKIHGHICARCGREFSGKNLRQLTVHHKDFDHFNNPQDGSNWENLCVYCHEDVHSREVMANRIDGAASISRPPERKTSGTISISLADKLKAAMNKKK